MVKQSNLDPIIMLPRHLESLFRQVPFLLLLIAHVLEGMDISISISPRVSMWSYFFEGAFDNIASRSDFLFLTNSVHPVKCLVLDHGIPMPVCQY